MNRIAPRLFLNLLLKLCICNKYSTTDRFLGSKRRFGANFSKKIIQDDGRKMSGIENSKHFYTDRA